MKTDLDLIRAEVDLAQDDARARERLARELHHLRHLQVVAMQRGRRLDALVYTAARTAPQPRLLPEEPEAPGTSRDLLREPITA